MLGAKVDESCLRCCTRELRENGFAARARKAADTLTEAQKHQVRGVCRDYEGRLAQTVTLQKLWSCKLCDAASAVLAWHLTYI